MALKFPFSSKAMKVFIGQNYRWLYLAE